MNDPSQQQTQTNTINKILTIFALSLLAITVLPRLVSIDMFSDGIWYASAARNMAEGVGDFWHPHYMEGIEENVFHHPPLGIWSQSLAFRIFGDSTQVEFFWGVIAGLAIVLLMGVLWKRLLYLKPDLPGTWWPVTLFVLTPITSWVMANNLLENTMTVFVMLGALAAYQAVRESSKARILAWAVMSGLMLSMAFLTKGVPGIFPLALPFLAGYFLEEVPLRRGLIVTASILGIILFFLGLMVIVAGQEAVGFFHAHFVQKLASSFSEAGELSGPRYYLIKKLILELMVPLSVGLVATVIHRLRSSKRFLSLLQQDGLAMLFLFVGLSGSLPLLIIPVQMGWYIFPSLPFFIIAISLLFRRQASEFESFLSLHIWARRLVSALAVVFISVSLVCVVFFQGKSVVRNKDFYNDLVFRPIPIPPRSQVTVYPKSVLDDWSLAANMQRLFRISVTAAPGHAYMITVGPLDTENFPTYTPVQNFAPARYHVYQMMARKP